MTAEFDRYAAGYDGNMDVPLKRLAGGDQDAFLDVKARWIVRDLARRPFPSREGEPLRLLDYGCGAGHLLRALRRHGFTGALTGCDPSQGMLDEARRAIPEGDAISLRHLESDRLPFPDASFDLAVACCVYHHIPPSERAAATLEVVRTLRPGGRLIVVEHNTKNPVTRFVVSRAKVDENAILLPTAESCALLRDAGLVDLRVDYVMFLPPRFAWAARLEDRLAWLPLGGQYVVAAEKIRPT